MVKAKCTRRECPFKFDDAEHVDDAVEKLKAHWRTEHRTKAFYTQRMLESVEIYNYTLDEAVALYAGQDWRQMLADGRRDSRHIRRACASVCQYPWQYPEELIREVQALSLEHGQEIQDPFQQLQEPVDLMGGVDGY